MAKGDVNQAEKSVLGMPVCLDPAYLSISAMASFMEQCSVGRYGLEDPLASPKDASIDVSAVLLPSMA